MPHVVLSTEIPDDDAPLIMPVLPGSRLADLPVRVSRSACLDGSQYIDRRGYFPADREIALKTKLNRADDARLARLIAAHERLTLTTPEGFFVGVIAHVGGSGGLRSIRFLPSGFTALPESVLVERPGPAEYSSGGIFRGDGTLLADWSTLLDYWIIEKLSGYSRKNFIYFSNVAVPGGATSLSALFTRHDAYYSGGHIEINVDVSIALGPVAMPVQNGEVAALEALPWSTPIQWTVPGFLTVDTTELTTPDLGAHIPALLAGGYDGAGILMKLDGSPYYATDPEGGRKLYNFDGETPPVLTVA